MRGSESIQRTSLVTRDGFGSNAYPYPIRPRPLAMQKNVSLPVRPSFRDTPDAA